MEQVYTVLCPFRASFGCGFRLRVVFFEADFVIESEISEYWY